LAAELQFWLARVLQNGGGKFVPLSFWPSQSFRAMKTSFSLLTREGAIVVAFDSVLTPEQFSRLFECVKQPISKAEMNASIAEVAREFGLNVVFDRELVGTH
jgi:hypothetical protein